MGGEAVAGVAGVATSVGYVAIRGILCAFEVNVICLAEAEAEANVLSVFELPAGTLSSAFS